MKIDEINTSLSADYAKSANEVLQVISNDKTIVERKKSLKVMNYEICYFPYKLKVGQILKVSVGNSSEYLLKFSSVNEIGTL